MEEMQLLALIAQGESEALDFKRDLDLQQARSKAEFIKDVIAIANSAEDTGYLLIGVNDDKTIVGGIQLEEEKIQQIVHTYISPNVIVRCELIPIASLHFLEVGVLEIKGPGKPHRVARDIERLRQNQVFIRHGTITAEASPEEMFRMRKTETNIQSEARHYAQAAEKHYSLGNADQAIKAYSRAIELNPTPDLFIARGKAYGLYLELDLEAYLDEEKARLAYKDFSDALLLAQSYELMRAARLERFRVCGMYGYDLECCVEDFEWLYSSTKGRELGEVLYLQQKALYVGEQGNEMELEALNRAIQLGYNGFGVYYLRASMHLADYNYGLALQDISAVMERTKVKAVLAGCLCMRAVILFATRQYEKAFDDLVEANKCGSDLMFWTVPSPHDLSEEVLYKISTVYRLGKLSGKQFDIYKQVLRVLVAMSVRVKEVLLLTGEEEIPLPSLDIEKDYPKIANVIRSIVGKEFLDIVKTDSEIVIRL